MTKRGLLNWNGKGLASPNQKQITGKRACGFVHPPGGAPQPWLADLHRLATATIGMGFSFRET